MVNSLDLNTGISLTALRLIVLLYFLCSTKHYVNFLICFLKEFSLEFLSVL